MVTLNACVPDATRAHTVPVIQPAEVPPATMRSWLPAAYVKLIAPVPPSGSESPVAVADGRPSV